MRTVIVFNHPYEGSFCNAILQATIKGLEKAGHEVNLIHLDKDEFDPVMRERDLKTFVLSAKNPLEVHEFLDPQVKDYKMRLEEAEHLVFIFPIWWELMPALTKGFIDKVIFPGIAYNYKENGLGMKPLLKNMKGITLITTMNTPGIAYRLLFGNAIKKAMLMGTFWKMGYKNRKWISLNMVKQVSDAKRGKWLQQIENRFMELR